MIIYSIQAKRNSVSNAKFCANIYRPPHVSHEHDYFEIAFPVKNECINVINGKKIAFTQGTCTLLRPKDNHYFECPVEYPFGDYLHKDVYISCEQMRQVCDALSPTLYEEIENEKEPIVFTLSSSYLKIAVQQTNLLMSLGVEYEATAKAILSSLVAMLLSKWIETKFRFFSKHMPDWLNTLLSKLSSLEYMLLPIPKIAADIGYTAEHLSREFHKYMETTLTKYIARKKMEYASTILASDNDVKIIDLANMLGYSNPSNFSKNFHDVFHCTPNQYREPLNRK